MLSKKEIAELYERLGISTEKERQEVSRKVVSIPEDTRPSEDEEVREEFTNVTEIVVDR